MRGFGTLCGLLSLGIVAAGVVAAARPVEVYAPATDYSVVRRADVEGVDRVYLTARVSKLLDCELERGDGPPWVEFTDGHDDVPPPSAFYRPDGTIAARTIHRAGESYVLEGYSAVIPHRLRGMAGFFTVQVPCQLWTTDEAGERVYGRKVVASYGPVAVPPAGGEARAVAGTVIRSWEPQP